MDPYYIVLAANGILCRQENPDNLIKTALRKWVFTYGMASRHQNSNENNKPGHGITNSLSHDPVNIFDKGDTVLKPLYVAFWNTLRPQAISFWRILPLRTP